MKKCLKKLICMTTALTATFACAATFTACETNYPEVKLEIEFNGETYELEYKLYRKVAPATVNHFLKLVENGYYDGVCVHDYDASAEKLYTGAYTYTQNADNGGLVYKRYYDIVKNYDEFPHTVWADEARTTPTYTLYGEFSDNGLTVKNGISGDLFGSLSMYYTSKSTSEDKVSVKRADGNGYSNKQYKYNSATSMFTIALSESATTSSAYCTFATLSEDSVDVLQDLKDAIEDFGDAFTSEFTLETDRDDAFVGDHGLKATYDVPSEAIVIKKATVEKY